MWSMLSLEMSRNVRNKNDDNESKASRKKNENPLKLPTLANQK